MAKTKTATKRPRQNLESQWFTGALKYAQWTAKKLKLEWTDDGQKPYPKLPLISAEAAYRAARQGGAWDNLYEVLHGIELNYLELGGARLNRKWEDYTAAFAKLGEAAGHLRRNLNSYGNRKPKWIAPLIAFLREIDRVLLAAVNTIAFRNEPEEAGSTVVGTVVFSKSGQYFAHLNQSKGLGWADIRDHWQGLSDAQRKEICPDDWGRLKTDQQKKGKPSKRHLADIVRGRARQWVKGNSLQAATSKK